MKYLATISFLFFSFFGFSQSKIAVIDYSLIFNSAPELPQINSQIETNTTGLSEKLGAKQAECEAKMNTYRQMADEGAGEDDINKIMGEINQCQDAMNALTEELSKEYDAIVDKAYQPLHDKIKSAIKTYCEANSITHVFQQNNFGGVNMLAYSKPQINITSTILKKLNFPHESASEPTFDANQKHATIDFEGLMKTAGDKERIEKEVAEYERKTYEAYVANPQGDFPNIDSLAAIKRNELYAPINQKLGDAIEKIAQSTGVSSIFVVQSPTYEDPYFNNGTVVYMDGLESALNYKINCEIKQNSCDKAKDFEPLTSPTIAVVNYNVLLDAYLSSEEGAAAINEMTRKQELIYKEGERLNEEGIALMNKKETTSDEQELAAIDKRLGEINVQTREVSRALEQVTQEFSKSVVGEMLFRLKSMVFLTDHNLIINETGNFNVVYVSEEFEMTDDWIKAFR